VKIWPNLFVLVKSFFDQNFYTERFAKIIVFGAKLYFFGQNFAFLAKTGVLGQKSEYCPPKDLPKNKCAQISEDLAK
jgi:hypothetical protein